MALKTDTAAPEPSYNDKRLQQLRDNATMLRELLVPPTEHAKTNVKVYRALYVLRHELVHATLVIRVGEPPQAWVTKRFGDNLTGCQQLSGQWICAEDHAVFLGLDECEPRVPQWKQDKGHASDLIIMRDAIGRPMNGR